MIEIKQTFDCNLPNDCLIETKKYEFNQFGYEKFECTSNCEVIKCKPLKDYELRFSENEFMYNKSSKCFINREHYKDDEYTDEILFEWPKKELIILEKSFEYSNLIDYSTYFSSVSITFLNLKGFDLILTDRNNSIVEANPNLIQISCVSCKIDFYTNRNLIKSCEDINSNIMSIFQIEIKQIAIDSSEFPNSLCPLVFKNSNIFALFLIGLVDTFYKRNVLSFTDDVFQDLDSSIQYLFLEKVENINLDLKLLNPYVFKDVYNIQIRGSVKTIDKNIFKELNRLQSIDFEPAYFRKMIHQNGIDWIKEINRNLTFNFSSKDTINEIIELINSGYGIKCLDIRYDRLKQNAPFYKVFPDEDFCVYKDFTFEQLVILMQYCEDPIVCRKENKEEFTCTYLWITQYFQFYYQYFFPDPNDVRSDNMKIL